MIAYCSVWSALFWFTHELCTVDADTVYSLFWQHGDKFPTETRTRAGKGGNEDEDEDKSLLSSIAKLGFPIKVGLDRAL